MPLGSSRGRRRSRIWRKVTHGHAPEVQTIVDAEGRETAVVISIEDWQEISSELETAYLLSNPVTREKLLTPVDRTEAIPMEEAFRRAGVQ